MVAEIRSRKRGRLLSALACNTLDEFTSAVDERDAKFRALVSSYGSVPLLLT